MIALSGGEAELYAAVLACSMGIGVQRLFRDLGLDLKIRVSMDATAGIAMMRRQSLGGAKHTATQYLWVQERIHAKDIGKRKVGTAEKLADLMTKPLAEAPMKVYLATWASLFQWHEDFGLWVITPYTPCKRLVQLFLARKGWVKTLRRRKMLKSRPKEYSGQ